MAPALHFSAWGRVPAMCVPPTLFLFLHDMYQLSDPAIKAILKEWHPKEYYPPYTDAGEWIDSIESLCNIYGIPNAQRLQCALGFTKKELSTELRKALDEAREWLGGPVNWTQFKSFLVVFDRRWDLVTIELSVTQILQRSSGSNGSVSLLPRYALVDTHTASSRQNFRSTRSIRNGQPLSSESAASC